VKRHLTLRGKIAIYFIALHLVVAAAALFVLMENRLLLFGVEALFVISIFVSYRIVQSLFVPFDLIRTGAELIAERDFTSRFVPVGQPEMDDLIRVYNGMIDRLREERLKVEEQHHFFARVIESSPSGIIICDFDGNPEQLNPAAQEVAMPELMAELKSLAPGESRLVTHAGPRKLKLWRAEFRDRGFPKTFFLIDELTDELRLSEKAAYEKLIRMMSHEVNNSVGAVRSLIDSSLRYAPQVGESDRADFVNALTIASSRIDALNRFMSAFADVVRIPPPHRSAVRLDAIVQRIAALMRPEAQSHNIVIRVHADESVAEVDEHQFEQVVVNIIRNAIDAIDIDGSIDITLRDGTLTFADSGPGIAADVVPDLFTPFFTTKREGRGLGLTIVQEILTNHGFTYGLRNRAEGGGAEFVIAS
jgi:two-component system nitrogen regulation sensor histidine kinase NtrY